MAAPVNFLSAIDDTMSTLSKGVINGRAQMEVVTEEYALRMTTMAAISMVEYRTSAGVSRKHKISI